MASHASAPVITREGPTFMQHRSRVFIPPILILLLIPLGPAPGQPAGRPPSPSRIMLYGLKAVSSSIICAVGKPGLILRSTNGGRSWGSITHPGERTDDLYGVDFIDRNRGWAVGWRGAILGTTDGGASWTRMRSGTSDNLVSVHFANPSTGWSAGFGGTILHTMDGGKTWTPQRSGVRDNLWSISFVGTESGWISGGSGTILHTSNGGKTWQAESSKVKSFLYCVRFVDGKTGWAVGGYGAILKTTDGGRSWAAQNLKKDLSVFESKAFHYSVHALSDTSVILVGSEGTILSTRDGGETWTQKASGTGATLFSVHLGSGALGWAAGGPGTIIKTTDCLPILLLFISASPALSQAQFCGIQWGDPYRVSLDSALSIRPLLSVDGDTVNILWFGLDTLGTLTNSGIQFSHSFDGGDSFSPETTLVPHANALLPGFMSSVGPFVYVVFAASIDTFYGTALVRSTDAGLSWAPPVFLRSNALPYAVITAEALVYVHFRESGNGVSGLMVSSDHGVSWSVRSTNTPRLDVMAMTRTRIHGLNVQASGKHMVRP
ncbi:MAG: hypothetical protein E6K56_07005 [Ignavibacteria bacterium]|nr:MAG: hypothetical protein E6K56_07005 [Ignavibacteria bacterium]